MTLLEAIQDTYLYSKRTNLNKPQIFHPPSHFLTKPPGLLEQKREMNKASRDCPLNGHTV